MCVHCRCCANDLLLAPCRDVRLRVEQCLACRRACTVEELEQLLLPQQAPLLPPPWLVQV
jgi:hypothetical protein